MRNLIRKIIRESIDNLLSSGKRVKAILRTKEAYQILDDSKAPGTTWTSGGCGILALALSEFYSAPIWAVYNTTNKHVEHFVVKVENGNFLDADGEHVNMIGDFMKNEIVHGELTLVPYDKKMNIGDIVMDENAAKRLVELFNKKLSNKPNDKILDEEINNVSEFKVGKCYQYSELPDDVTNDIEVQFKNFVDGSYYEGYPEEYKYCFRLLEPSEIMKYLPLVKTYVKEYKKGDRDYLEKIIASIKEEGLNYPAVGMEGNHRGAIFYLLNRPLPYLEIKD